MVVLQPAGYGLLMGQKVAEFAVASLQNDFCKQSSCAFTPFAPTASRFPEQMDLAKLPTVRNHESRNKISIYYAVTFAHWLNRRR